MPIGSRRERAWAGSKGKFFFQSTPKRFDGSTAAVSAPKRPGAPGWLSRRKKTSWPTPNLGRKGSERIIGRAAWRRDVIQPDLSPAAAVYLPVALRPIAPARAERAKNDVVPQIRG